MKIKSKQVKNIKVGDILIIDFDELDELNDIITYEVIDEDEHYDKQESLTSVALFEVDDMSFDKKKNHYLFNDQSDKETNIVSLFHINDYLRIHAYEEVFFNVIEKG